MLSPIRCSVCVGNKPIYPHVFVLNCKRGLGAYPQMIVENNRNTQLKRGDVS